LGSNSNRELEDLFFDLGLDWIVRETMPAALNALRHDSFAAVVLDRDHVEVDVLEFILNVRDIDKRTPVVVMSREPHGRDGEVLLARADTLLLNTCGSREELASQIEKIVAENSVQEV